MILTYYENIDLSSASVNISIVSQYHIIYTDLKVHNCILSGSSNCTCISIIFYSIFAVEQNNEQDTDYTKAGNSLPPSQVVIGNGKVPVTQISCGQYHSGKYIL